MNRNGAFWGVMVAGLAVILLGVVFSSRFGSDPDLVASPLLGKPVPELSLPYLEFPGELDLTEVGDDITVVNFWASWCLGCRQEHAALLQAAADYEEFGVTFVGVLYQDQPGRGLDFLSELGRGEPYAYVVDGESRAALEFGVLGLPETFFVDRTGTIVGKVSGPVDYPLLSRTLDAIVLGESVGEVTTGEVENRG